MTQSGIKKKSAGNHPKSGPADRLSIVRASQKPIETLIVDDSKLIRTAIRKILESDPGIRVTGEAADGREALEIIPELKPEVITLDVNMPRLDGISTLKHIMIKHPTPTVMISSLTREGATKTFDALRFGAIDFITKPSQFDGDGIEAQHRTLLEKIKLTANVETRNIRFFRPPARKDYSTATTAIEHTAIERCVVLGASEGGYNSLLKIIPHLPPNQPATYLGVLHVAPLYVDAFVNYLNQNSLLPVKRAIDGLSPESGTCYLAAGTEYITLVQAKGRLSLRVHPSPFPTRRGAINMLMLSISEIMREKTTGIILSGQGEDGAEGVAEIARIGGEVIIQSPSTCMFKEMPQASIERCETARILPDIEIADVIRA